MAMPTGSFDFAAVTQHTPRHDLINSTTGRPFMSIASRDTDLTQIDRAVGLQTSRARLRDFAALMKPRVMSLVVFTALVGLWIAPGHIDPLTAFVALLG